MPKNALQRLNKIEKDLKTVVSIFEVANKCKNVHGKSETQEHVNNELQLSQINLQLNKIEPQFNNALESIMSSNTVRAPQISQLDFLKKTPRIAAPFSQDVYSKESVESTKNCKPKKPRSALLSFSTLSTVSYVEAKQTDDYSDSKKQDPVPKIPVINNNSSKVNLIPHSKKFKEERENGKIFAGTNHFVSSTASSSLTDYPDWLQNTASNRQGSITHPNSVKNEKCSSGIYLKNSKSNERNLTDISDEKKRKSKQTEKIHLTVKRENFESEFKNSAGYKNNQQKTINVVKHENDLWADEFTKVIEKSNEKLEKMKVSKEIALHIAKHLKAKYDETQQSKQELMEKLLEVQKDNARMKSKLKESKTKQKQQCIKTNEMVEENFRALQTRIFELEREHHEELLERQREIDKIQRERLVEIKNELKSKENQKKDIQQLSYENCELLERNDELALLLKESHLENQFLEQKIRQLQEEIQKQKQHLKIKEKTLGGTIKELESVRQSSSDVEEQVKILKKSIENFDETQKKLIKRTEEYEVQAKQDLEEMKKLQNENLTLKTELENEKDALLIKAKIIEDQQETIKQLKEKSEEAKALLKKKESLERILNIEREEKLELQDAVERLKWRKEELKKKIRGLESDLLLAPQEVARDLQKTQVVLFELENQVYSKQKEWELQLHSLIREKEQACSIAEFATKKLIQTSSEFQKQSEAHKTLHRILAKH